MGHAQPSGRGPLLSRGRSSGAIALVPLGVVGEEFVPPTDRGQIYVQLTYPHRDTADDGTCKCRSLGRKDPKGTGRCG